MGDYDATDTWVLIMCGGPCLRAPCLRPFLFSLIQHVSLEVTGIKLDISLQLLCFCYDIYVKVSSENLKYSAWHRSRKFSSFVKLSLVSAWPLSCSDMHHIFFRNIMHLL